MKPVILRRKGVGAKSCPIIAEEIDAEVISTENGLPPTGTPWVIRWGTIKSIDPTLKVVNKSKAIEKSSDKKEFRQVMQSEGLCPKTWFSLAEFTDEHYGASFVPQKPVQRVLIRPREHSRSESMFLCTGLSEANKAISDIGGSYYISEFIQKTREFRVMVVQGKVVWMIEKHPKSEEDVSWGCVEEGTFDYVYWSEWHMDSVRKALRAVALAGLDFGAVDVIVDPEGTAFVLEVNTAPWLSPYYARKIGKALKWIIEGKEVEQKEITDWKSAIHPSSL